MLWHLAVLYGRERLGHLTHRCHILEATGESPKKL